MAAVRAPVPQPMSSQHRPTGSPSYSRNSAATSRLQRPTCGSYAAALAQTSAVRFNDRPRERAVGSKRDRPRFMGTIVTVDSVRPRCRSLKLTPVQPHFEVRHAPIALRAAIRLRPRPRPGHRPEHDA